MAGETSKLKQVSDVEWSPNGQVITLNIEAENGDRLGIELDKSNIEKLIVDLLGIATMAAEKRTKGVPIPLSQQGQSEFRLLRATHIGVGVADSQGKSTFLVVRLFDFDLSFQLNPDQVESLGESFVQMSQALSAPENNAH